MIDEFYRLPCHERANRLQQTLSDWWDGHDVGLSPLQPVHVKAAWHCLRQTGKKMFLADNPFPDADRLTRVETMRFAARCWHVWGVLTASNAPWGEILMMFAQARLRPCQPCHDIHALPYMRDWFDASMHASNEPMMRAHTAWVAQLEQEVQQLERLPTGSAVALEETNALLSFRRQRLERARRREADWLVTWMMDSFPVTDSFALLHKRYNSFEQLFLWAGIWEPSLEGVCVTA